ncbi:arginyl-tRNA synthetase [Granulicatella balaenopterae]|uniref:Arginine--tRNA ligase n=1 Tax=Granulicatella balaenopterae TaxID=137733 RepID=A0A1H9M386_9LACT|nr:arginine--tRNA ligase [Granulicatella balaenopterae]SER17999.1 arginyl-tRNA synthetase [Granulicatella balaenopterae]
MDYKKLVAEQILKTVGEHLSYDDVYNMIEVPKYSEHGDLAFPAFSLAKILRKAPQAIAEDIVAGVEDEHISKAVATGPYANFFLNRDKFADEVLKTVLEQGEHYGDWTFGEGRNVTVDMSSPNIAKPMSMGHLRSTVIGNSIAKLADKVGYNSVKINHLGDWGTQFGKLIVGYKKWGSEEAVLADPIAELLRLYVKFHEEAEEDPELEEQGRAWFKKLEDGDPEAERLWKWFKTESLKEFNRVYDMLGVEFDSYAGEAFYNDKMDEVVDLLETEKIATIDNGATVVHLDNYDLPPALIKKSDGATLYITRDLAAALYRKRNYDFAKSIYVVGNEQANHFRQLKAVLNEMGWDWQEQMQHIPFGLITLGGKKLSTRKGKIVLLEQVLNDSTKLALEQIEAKNPDLPNKEEVAKQVGVGAVVFHDLKNDRMNNFDFVLEDVVQFEGETGPYVQYTRARAMSILRKAGKEIDTTAPIALEDDYAWEVLKLIENYPNVVKFAEEKAEPSVIAKFVISLAQAFNKYYANSRILVEDENLNSRLALVDATQSILKQGLDLLGVESPDEM